MFLHDAPPSFIRRWQAVFSLFFSVVLLSLLVVLLLPASGSAFPINEWDKLEVEAAAPSAVEIEPGKPWREPLSGITFVWIPGGCFSMGSPPDAEGRDADEEPLHSVCLSGFWLGEREVTQQQWQRVMQHNPSQLHHEMIGQKDEGFPVENISRLDVESFLTKLNAHHRGTVALKLPTEAQWEYACRNGGQKIPFAGYGQVDQMGWYQSNSSGTSQSTGTRLANRLGLFDMNGNVWEWIQDTYDKEGYRQHAQNDPLYAGTAPYSVVRGGSWRESTHALRCANRGFERVANKRSDLGLRVAATVDMEATDAEVKSGAARSNRARGEMPF